MLGAIFKKAPHTPPHLFVPNALYMLTASTYRSEPFMQTTERKLNWIKTFLTSAEMYKWEVVAWVVLDNHYHAVLKAPDSADNLPKFVASYHRFTARNWNEEEQASGRKVWWNYWDTCIRSEYDYYNRLRYTFWNPVMHSLVKDPNDYPFSSYKVFLSKWKVKFNFTNMEEVKNVPEF
ncbi:MAG TPA: transposase [Anaerolineales bacterium]|nr:transposase [Anaerolineales bacterium]HNH03852.1 transposase [Anaerolineales bacterium]HNH79069.1 transposase [Anaerolineales bacterium]HNO84086.1 transposase [Anaerolineales bacterium]